MRRTEFCPKEEEKAGSMPSADQTSIQVLIMVVRAQIILSQVKFFVSPRYVAIYLHSK